MERLTKTYLDGTHGASDSLPCGENSYDYKNLLIERLGKYEDLEEQGRLIKLPCKVGDTVWQIMVVGVQGKNIKYGIFKAIVTKISVDYQMNFLLSTITKYEKRYRNEVTSTAIGDTMFFTKSEAEAKLKELREA
jgi:hypothetical protein